jgi:hypothetical protein
MMDEDKTFLGIPETVVRAVGKMVLAAARVEHFATDIAYQVGVPDAKDLTMDRLRTAIKAKLNADGVAEGLAVTATEIKAWLADATAVYGRRSGIVHGVFMLQRFNEKWELIRLHPRPNENRLISESEIDAVTADLLRLQSTGIDLVGRMAPGGAMRRPLPSNPDRQEL